MGSFWGGLYMDALVPSDTSGGWSKFNREGTGAKSSPRSANVSETSYSHLSLLF